MINMGELFANDRIYDIPMEYVPCTEKEKENAKIEKGDLLFARQSLIESGAGKCSIVMDASRLTVFESHLIRIRLNYKLANPLFYYYYFKSGLAPIKSIVTQGVQAGIKASDLAKLSVIVPPFDIQNRIASFLDTIDRKIETNNRINGNLLEQAQALYRDWFLDGMHFSEEEKGSWQITTLGDIAEMKTTVFNPLKNPDVVVEHYSIPAYDETHFPVFEKACGIKSNKYKISSDSILISKLNPDTKRIWRPLCVSNVPVCSTEFLVYEARDKRFRDFLFSVLDSKEFSDYLCSHVTGSTGSRQRAVPKDTLDFTVRLPNEAIIKEFCDMVTPIYDLIASNELENQKLKTMRDRLLPRLMSGELDVSEIEL